MSAVVAAAVAGAVAGAVGGAVGGAAGGAIGGAGAGAGGGGLVAIIGPVQVMACKAKMQLGGTGKSAFASVASGMDWTVGNIAIPGKGGRRRLLDAEGTNAFSQAERLAFWTGSILLPALILHTCIVHALAKYKPQWRPKGLLDSPQLPLTVAFMLLNPFASAAARILAVTNSGDLRGIGICLAYLISIPLPIIVFACVHIFKYIYNSTDTVQFVRHSVPHEGRVNQLYMGRLDLQNNRDHEHRQGRQNHKPKPKRHKHGMYLTPYQKGEWHGDPAFLSKYNMLFKTLRGRTFAWADVGATWDPTDRVFKASFPVCTEHASWKDFDMGRLRLFFTPYDHVKNVLVILLLGGFQDAPVQGSLPQVTLLLMVTMVHISAILGIMPFNCNKTHVVELISTTGELGTYVAAFVLVLTRHVAPAAVVRLAPLADQMLLAAQLVSVFSKILGQAWLAADVWPDVRCAFWNKVRPGHMAREDRQHVLAFKYANRWYARTFACHLPRRAHYFIVPLVVEIAI